MAETTKAEAVEFEEERLAHALISRGLITREEFLQLKSGDGATTTLEVFLKGLIKGGFLTASQARRAMQELPPLLKQPIPGYELKEKLGQGAMGTVYKARQLSMDRLVAIKILSPKQGINPEFLKRFTREARLAAKFSSNNVVQAIDVGSAGPLHYFVMEYVEGVTIKEELEKGKTFEEREASDIVLQIAQALQHAHRRQLIHRDVKPANIILTREGIAKLADLGMARGTSDAALAKAEKGLTIGTPYYISPEQIEGREDVDSRADMYSLGATYYHMLTGRPPFPYKKVEQLLEAHLEEELTPPDHINTNLSGGVGEVIEFMMAKDRKQRYQTPGDLITDLECLMNGEPPKLARQRVHAASLQGLSEGEADEEEGTRGKRRRLEGVPLMWVIVLGAALAVSLLANVIQLMR